MFRALYPYQAEAVRQLLAKVETVSPGIQTNLQLLLATGLGKTKVAAAVVAERLKPSPKAKRKTQRALFLCHHGEILNQAEESFQEFFDAPAYRPAKMFSMARYRPKTNDWKSADIVFATLQSLSVAFTKGRMPFAKGHFSEVIVDENHHGPAKTFKEVIEYFQCSMRLGMSATREESRVQAMKDLFGEPVFTLSLEQALQENLLVPVDYRVITDDLKGLAAELKKVDEGEKKLSLAQLNKSFLIPERDERLIEELTGRLSLIPDPRTIIFCPRMEYCDWIASKLPDTVSVHSDLKHSARQKRLAEFRNGKKRTIVTVDWLNEKIDVPEANVAVFLRTTQSRRIWDQQLGRILRRAENKSRAYVLDFVGNCDRLKAISEFMTKVKGTRAPKTKAELLELDLPECTFEFDEVAVDVLRHLKTSSNTNRKERLLADLKSLAAKLKRIPSSIDCKKASRKEIAHPATFREAFGSWNQALTQAGFDLLNHSRSDATLIQELQNLAAKLGQVPTVLDCDAAPRNEIASSSSYRDRFGSWEKALEMAGIESRRLSDADLIVRLQNLAKSLGHTPTVKEVNKQPRTEIPDARTFVSRFGTWAATLTAANLESERYRSDERLLDDLRTLRQQIGKVPSISDLHAAKNLLSSSVYFQRFGSWLGALRAAGILPA